MERQDPFQRDTLFIRETKFSKNRIVPMGPKHRHGRYQQLQSEASELFVIRHHMSSRIRRMVGL